MKWRQYFDTRKLQEIDFSRHYAEHYRHGTDGHNAKLIIAKFAALMDEIEEFGSVKTIEYEWKPQAD